MHGFFMPFRGFPVRWLHSGFTTCFNRPKDPPPEGGFLGIKPLGTNLLRAFHRAPYAAKGMMTA
jgi:hypothetical protein